MIKITHEIASCENHAHTYMTESAVFRRVDGEHSMAVESILAQIKKSEIDGIVDTKIVYDMATLDFFDVNARAILLEHKLVEFISYPHEWCSLMFRDAALFHLQLSKKLSKIGLYLKDAHPWNILFEQGRPLFIDFSSIVTESLLLNERFLQELGGNNIGRTGRDKNYSLNNIQAIVLDAMFHPYFYMPILGYAYGNRTKIRKFIEFTTLNAATSTIATRDVFPSLKGSSVGGKVRAIKNIFLIAFKNWQLKNIRKKLTLNNAYAGLSRFLDGIDVKIGETAYSTYYKNKNEDVSWKYSNQWNEKQKSIYRALNQPHIQTVVDVACNTGWYSILAESLGKKVIAFDIDEGCVEFLYKFVKKERKNILPLVMDFTNLTQNRHSIVDGKKVLINAVDRFQSDSVIALGIVHHLFLGMGMSFRDIVKKLDSLSKNQLIIEFVDPIDPMIENERSFFPAFYKNENLIKKYNLDSLLSEIEDQGYGVKIQKSHPETRIILECTKCEPSNSI